MCTSQSLYSFVCNEEIVFNEYLARYLVFIRDRLALFSGETTFKGISKSTLLKVEILLPPLSEQRRIAAILREADEIRKLRRQANEKAQEIVSALFYDMFGDPATNPKGWKTTTLEDVCILITDGTQQPPPFVDTSGIPFLFVGNIVNGKIDLNTSKHISKQTYRALSKRCPVERGDLLYSTVGSYGVPVVVETDEPFAFQRHIALLKPDRDKINPFFLRSMLNTSYVKDQVDRRVRGIAQGTLNLGEVAQLSIYIPSPSLQEDFTNKVDYIQKTIEGDQTKAFQGVDTLHQSLLARAFTGDLTAMWREQHAEELAQAARERDRLLAQLRLAPAEYVTPAQPTRSEIGERQELLALLNDVQKALLAMLDEQPATYYTANSAHEELLTIECSLDVVRRELHFLAAAGWIKDQSLPAEDEAGVRYIPVYRFLLSDDDSQQPDIDQLIVRLGPEYPDEVLV